MTEEKTKLEIDDIKSVEKQVDVEQAQPDLMSTDMFTKDFFPPAFRQSVDAILGKLFKFEIEEIGGQQMAVVTVPDKYRNQKVIEAYVSHWHGKRKLYENELTRVNPHIKYKEKQQELAEYDKTNPTPVVPKDQRHKAMSTIHNLVDLRKWLVLIKTNVIKELVASRKPTEQNLPTSLDEDLAKIDRKQKERIPATAGAFSVDK